MGGVAPYAFGDSVPAARRLALVAEAFEPSSRAFLERFAGATPALAVDLGCGPGHTTLLLDEVLRPRQTLGLDQSATFLEVARATARQGIVYLEHDVTTVPFPERPVAAASRSAICWSRWPTPTTCGASTAASQCCRRPRRWLVRCSA
jgi:SAM-dependent methyltransferase